MRFPLVFLARFILLLVGAAAWAVAEEIPYSPTKWEKEIAAYEAQDQANPPAKGGIVFVGSSSIRLWKTLAEDFPNHHVLNRGFGGSQLGDSAYFAERLVLPYEPRMVVVYAGGNDLNANKTPEQIFAAFQEFAGKVRARLPETTIAYISIAGNPRRWAQVERVKAANRLIADFIGTQKGMKFIDVFPKMLGEDELPLPDIFVADRLHMNGKGYQLWKAIIGPQLPPSEG